jgi:succinate dehydrogenase / fumarate reductase flavoprotein subunit
MKIFPGVHYSMGGLWTTYTPKPDLKGLVYGAPNSMMTNIEGLYAFGEVNYQYHGANRLGANALLSCIFDGLFCGAGVANFAREQTPAADASAAAYDAAAKREEQAMKSLLDASGSENPYAIGKELGDEMTAASTVVKSGPRLEQALDNLAALRDRYRRIRLSDTGMWTNQTLAYARAVGDMLALADPMLRGGLAREESRGSHYRTDFEHRDDERFLKTTIARYDAASGESRIEFEPIESGLVTPRSRTYGKVEGGGSSAKAAASPHA